MNVTHVNAELTRACNLRCTYCFNLSGSRMPNELSLDEWKRVIDIAVEMGAKSFLFTGGDPMSRPDTKEIIRYALDMGVESSILANGHNLHELGAEILGRMKRVQISLDSVSRETHDARRGRGSWQDAINAIEYVNGIGTPVELSITVSQETLQELDGIAKLAYETGSKVLIRPLQSIGRAAGTEKTELTRTIDAKVEHLKETYGDIFVDDFAKYVPVLGADHDKIVAGHGVITVLPDGVLRGSNAGRLVVRDN